MTTIAYNHKDKEIAVDSRTTCDGIVADDNTDKVIDIGGVLFIGCGLPFDIMQLAKAYPGELPDADYAATVYAIDNGVVYRMGQSLADGYWIDECSFTRSDGSGDKFALAAMDFGCSAKDAVKYAMTRDVYSGGKVKVIKVK